VTTRLLRRDRGCAFTLVELLVVIGVIALLMGILLPVLGRCREAARSVQCMSNLRQIGVLTHAYVHDSRGIMPRSQHSAFPNRVAPWGYAFFESITGDRYRSDDATWKSVLNGLYRCPRDARTTRWSYGYNVYFELSKPETGGRTWNRMSSAPFPAATVLFGELKDNATADHAMAHFWTQYSSTPEIAADRHGRTCVHLYLDGHAVNQSFSMSFDRVRGRNQWNPATAP